MSRQADYDFIGPIQIWDGELWCPVCENSLIVLESVNYIHVLLWTSYSHMKEKHPLWNWDIDKTGELEA